MLKGRSYKIGSFNVKNLSLNADRDLNRIASIIKDNNLDIVALQEVLGEGKILSGIQVKGVSGQSKGYERGLMYRLGSDWKMCWSVTSINKKDPSGLKEDTRGEGYAFLWRKDKFDIIQEKGKEILPKIWTNYRFLGKEGHIRIREPFYGRFKIDGRPVELRLITTHIIYGKDSSEQEEMRKNEFKILAGQIYKRIKDHQDVNATAAYTIILGDYNLNLETSDIGGAILPEVMCFDAKGYEVSEDRAKTIITTVQSEKTTLQRDSAGYANNFDHFSYDDRVKSDIVKDVSVINAVCPNGAPSEEDFQEYRRKVSDHLPIVIEVRL